MLETNVIEGRWEDILKKHRGGLVGRRVKICVEPIDEKQDRLAAMLERMKNCTDEEIMADREAILATANKG